MRNVGQDLEDDLSWREAELSSLKLLVLDSTEGSARHKSLLRALCALLYAHYEGFCKFAWDYYLGTLEELKLPRHEFVDCLSKLSLQKDLRGFRSDLSDGSIWDLCTRGFTALMQRNITFELKLETNSNLWPKLLIENSTSVGLECATAQEHSVKLKSLVARRNEIAHGQKMTIATLAEYQEYENAAITVMHELAVSILSTIDSKGYLSPAQSGASR